MANPWGVPHPIPTHRVAFETSGLLASSFKRSFNSLLWLRSFRRCVSIASVKARAGQGQQGYVIDRQAVLLCSGRRTSGVLLNLHLSSGSVRSS
jgi:hypothetical protein